MRYTVCMNTKSIKKLSFHPKFGAVVDFIGALALLFFFRFVDSWPWLVLWCGLRIGLWIFLVRVVYYGGVKRISHFFSLIFFLLGSTFLYVFNEWRTGWYLLSGVYLLLPAFSFWLLPPKSSVLTFELKPERRVQLLLTFFGLAGVWSGIGAIILFNVFSANIFWWAWLLVPALFTTVASGWWWREYEVPMSSRLWWWVVAIFFLANEFGWIFIKLPSAFLVLGALMSWWWYVVWLMGRFHLSAEGIDWHRQRWFLAGNMLLLGALLVFVIRWH